MLIISQNKEVLANFTNSQILFVDEENKNGLIQSYVIGVVTRGEDSFRLGSYNTQERALGILRRIAECEGATNLFEMPEE